MKHRARDRQVVAVVTSLITGMTGATRVLRTAEGNPLPTPRRSRRTLRLAAATAAALATGALATPASADPFGQSGSITLSIPVDTNHSYCFVGTWTETERGHVARAMASLDDQTTYTDILHSSCTDATRLRLSLDRDSGARGTATCTQASLGADGQQHTPDDRCSRYNVTLNPSQLSDGHQWRKTACHEIGHTTGLAHGRDTKTFWNDCMVSGAVPAGAEWVRYNAHHVAHISSRTPAKS